MELDPPYHTKTREVIERALSPRAVGKLRESFREAADKLIDELLEKESFEAVSELAETFSTTVFPDAVGLRETDRRRLVDYGEMVFSAIGPDNALRRNSMAKGLEAVPWIMEQCQRHRLKPEGFGATIYAAADKGEITQEETGRASALPPFRRGRYHRHCFRQRYLARHVIQNSSNGSRPTPNSPVGHLRRRCGIYHQPIHSAERRMWIRK